MSKPLIIKNTSGSAIALESGFKIGAGEQIEAPYRYSLDIEDNASVITHLTSGDLVINDGVSDLTTIQGIKYISMSSSEHLEDTLEPSGFVNRIDSTFSFDDATRIFTIEPVGELYNIYMKGIRVPITAPKTVTLDLTDAEGVWNIYFDSTINLVAEKCLIPGEKYIASIVNLYFDETNDTCIGLSDERHGLAMDFATRSKFHDTIHTTYKSGFDIDNYYFNGTGDLNDDVQFSLNSGIIYDDDIQVEISHVDTSTNFFEQNLNDTIHNYASIPIVYREGANGDWRKTIAVDAPILLSGGIPVVNSWNGSSWELEQIPTNRYYVTWVVATTNIHEPVKAFVGQRYDIELEYAQLYNNISDYDFGMYPFPEMKFIYKLIYHTKSNYNNTYISTLVDISDLRTVGSERVVTQISPAVSADLEVLRSGMNRQLANMLVNSLEIQALKIVDMSPNLSYFVDSFNDLDLVDPESVNYDIEEKEGYIGLQQGGNFTILETTLTQFNAGIFNNIESFIDVGGDGAIQKEQLTIGGINLLEDFESISDVDTIGSAQQSQTELVGTYYEGSYGLRLNLNFSGSSLTESSTTTIDLSASGIDISLDKFIELYFLKPMPGSMNYELQLEDTLGATYTFPIEPLGSAPVFQKITKLLSEVIGIDTTNIRYVRFTVIEDQYGQTLLNIDTGSGTGSESVYSTRSCKQTFRLLESAPCQRIRLKISYAAAKVPTEPLYVGVANVFNTTLGTAGIEVIDASSDPQEFYLTFDTAFNLVADTTYSILLQSASSNPWVVELISGSDYTSGAFFRENTELNYDMDVSLYTPSIVESLYIDALQAVAESSYQITGSFTSKIIDIGVIPETLEKLYWTKIDNGDIISTRIRFANTEGDIATATWSNYFTDSSGDTSVVSGIVPYKYYQFELTWSGGDTTGTTIVKDVGLDYTVSAGSGSSIIISSAENTSIIPLEFVMMWEDELGDGSINYYVSRDGKISWQSVLDSERGSLLNFTSGEGTQLHLKAILTGSAKLYGWSLACDQNFI